MRHLHHLLALSAALALSACAQSGPIRVGSTIPPDFPYASEPCLQTGQGCRLAASTALRLGNDRLAGQYLVLDAASRGEDEVAAGRAGLWLAPGAYAPAPLYGRLNNSGMIPATTHGPGALVFDNVDAPAEATSLALKLPARDRGLYAGWLAKGSGHTVAAWREEGAVRVAPAAPLLAWLAVDSLAVTDGWETARLLSLADSAVDAGRASDGWALVGEAIEALPAGATASERATLHWVRYLLATAATADHDESFEALEEACAGDEGSDCGFLRAIALLYHHRGWSPTTLPPPWQSDRGRTAWAEETIATAERVGGDRQELLTALVQEMLYGTSRPKGLCDTEFKARTLAAMAPHMDTLRALGREELLLGDGAEALWSGKPFQAKDVARLLAWVAAPERRWLRTAALSQAMRGAAPAARRDDAQHKLAPVCTAYFASVRADMESDTADGAVDRSLDRLLAAVTASAGCPDRAQTSALTDYVLQRAMAADEGASTVLALLGQAVFELVITALTGGSVPDVMASAVMLRDGLVTVEGGLGQSPSDENLRAVLAVAIGLVDTLTGRPTDLQQVLRDAATALDPGDAQPATDAPDILRFEPGLHLGALSLLALSHLLQGDMPSVAKVLGAMERVYARDLRALLVAIDQATYADEVVRLTGGLVAVGKGFAADAPALDPLFAAVAGAAVPGTDERGGWAVGLALGRAILWDLAAVVGAEDTQRVMQAGAGADAALATLATRAITDFELEGTAWEMLHTLPALHRGVFSWVTRHEEGMEAFAAAAPQIQTALQDALGKLPRPLREAGPGELGLMAIVVDGMEAVTEVGVAAVAGDGALTRLGEALARKSAAWSPRYRALGDSIAGSLVLGGGGDAGLARRMFDGAAAASETSGGSDAVWVPRVLEAGALARAGDNDGADAVAASLLGTADEALACDVVHPGQSLLLYRAWNHERSGRHAQADAALARYLGFVEADGYAGDGLVRCYAASHRRHFTLNADVSQRVGQMFLHTSADSTFQVGAGLQSSVSEGDSFECLVAPLPATRLDLVLSAQLMRAAYAMRAGDARAADAALHRASRTAKIIFFGTPGPVDPAVAGGLADARTDKVPLGLVLWVAQLARGYGHISASWFLDEFATALAQQRGTTPAALEVHKDVPAQLAQLGLDGLGPVVAAWWSGDDKALLAAVAAAPVPRWSGPVYTVRRHQVRAEPALAASAGAALRAPKDDPVGAALVQKLGLILSAEAGKIPDPATVRPVVQALLVQGLKAEAAGLVRTLATLAARTDSSKVLPFVTLGLELLPRDGGAIPPQVEMLLQALPLMEAAGTLDVWARNMAFFLPQMSGGLPLNAEYEAVRIALQILPSLPDGPEQMAPLTRIYVSILRAQAGADSPETISWSVVDIAARAAVGEVDSDRLESVTYRVLRHPELDPRFRAFLEQLAKVQADSEAATRLGTQFISSLSQ